MFTFPFLLRQLFLQFAGCFKISLIFRQLLQGKDLLLTLSGFLLKMPDLLIYFIDLLSGFLA